MKKRFLIIAALLGCTALVALPKILPLFKSSAQSKAAASGGASTGAAAGSNKLPKASVQAVIVAAQDLSNTIRTSGTLLPGDEVELHTEVAGVMTKLNIAEGKNVSKDSLLLKLNDADLQAQLRKALSRKKLVETQEARQKQLLAIKSISQNEYDVAVNELNSVRAEIDLIQAQIRRTEIRAPFAGTIGLKYVSRGAYITPTTRIASLVDIAKLKLDFSIPGQYASLVKTGDVVRFTLQNSAAQGVAEPFIARIYAIEPKIDAMTRTVQIRALFDNTKRTVLPGAFATIELDLQNIPQTIIVPSEALIPELKGQKLFVARGGKAKAIPVEAGIRTERVLQIVSGIQPGDTVITTGLLQIRDGSPITVGILPMPQLTAKAVVPIESMDDRADRTPQPLNPIGAQSSQAPQSVSLQKTPLEKILPQKATAPKSTATVTPSKRTTTATQSLARPLAPKPAAKPKTASQAASTTQNAQ